MNNKKYDLIVIGGGILGTFHAYHALQNGLSVLQLEKDNFPLSSTVRNFGQVVPSGMSGVWFDYGLRGLDIYNTIQQEFDISVRNNGSIYIASDEQETQLIHELAAHYAGRGYAHQLCNTEQIMQKYPDLRASYCKEALLFPQELSVEPETMIRRLHSYLQQKYKGYTLHCNKTVIDCQSSAQGATVSTGPAEAFHAEKVVICNGYEFKILFRELFEKSGLQISKLQMMRSMPLKHISLPGNILTGLTIRRYESFADYCPSFAQFCSAAGQEELQQWGIHILFKQAIDGSIIIGDSHEYTAAGEFEAFGFQLNAHINQLMLHEANRIMPITSSQISSTWAGYYAQHDDHILEIDIDSRLHVRTGIGGKGMTASAGYAEHSINSLYAI